MPHAGNFLIEILGAQQVADFDHAHRRCRSVIPRLPSVSYSSANILTPARSILGLAERSQITSLILVLALASTWVSRGQSVGCPLNNAKRELSVNVGSTPPLSFVG